MKVTSGFKDFLLKQNVVSLAIGVVIGGAVGKVVSALVDDLVMPLIGLLLPSGDWRTAELKLGTSGAIKYGDLIGRFLDFLVIALVVFFLVRYLFKLDAKPAAPVHKCAECLEPIPAEAKRCKACGEPQRLR